MHIPYFNIENIFQAKTEKLKPLEIELRRLEDLSDSIVNGKLMFKECHPETLALRDRNINMLSR